jgi:ATP-dependent exoDNAse (exonuclease V) beta subunit
MDHDSFKSPMLWVKSEKSLFKNAGHLPVLYSSKLKETFFSEFYENEVIRCYLDNLNLLYVAFTRAEQGLIVSAPFSEKNQRGFSVARLIQDTITSSIELQSHWNQNLQQWKTGEVTPSAITKKVEIPPLSLRVYQTSRWRDRLVIKRSPSSFFEKVDEDQMAKVKYGLRMHAVLSRIRYADEINETLNTIITEGLITSQESDDVKKQLNELLAQPQIADWFSNKWEVRTEVPILVPSVDESRIDRLMTAGKKAIVVDFKTGERNKKDIQQVDEYVKILRQMNFTEVEGYVLYLRDGEVYDVSQEKKQKLKKSKDESQLGLGF